MSSSSSKRIHEQFHEAQRRVSRPQEPVKHRSAGSLLLPAPNNIIFELFNTIVREMSSERLLDYITNHLEEYLDTQWSNKITRQVVGRLRREQAVDIRAGLVEAPVLSIPKELLDTTYLDRVASHQTSTGKSASPGQRSTISNGSSSSSKSSSASFRRRSEIQSPPDNKEQTTKRRRAAIKQIYELVMWQIKTRNVTQITSFLIKLVIDFGFKSNKLKAEAYDEVVDCLRDWRAKKLIKLYAFGCAPANDQKLVLSSTNHGDLTRWVANYIDGTDKRQQPDLLRKLALALRDKTKNCIYLTNELADAVMSIGTGSIRCALLVDRLNQYDNLESLASFSDQIKPLMVSGKLYVISTLDCVEFAPDPTSDNCC